MIILIISQQRSYDLKLHFSEKLYSPYLITSQKLIQQNDPDIGPHADSS